MLDCIGTPYTYSLTAGCSDNSTIYPEGTYVEIMFIVADTQVPTFTPTLAPNYIGLWQSVLFYGEANCQGSFISFESNVNTFQDVGTGCINFSNSPYKSGFFTLSDIVPEYPTIPDNEPFTVYR